MVLETPRLILRQLTLDDAAFVMELVNEPAWVRFIGQRNVHSLADARGYIARGPLQHYARPCQGHYAVVRKSDEALLGICGLIKRDTLEDMDLGFAFLERFRGFGYGRESAAAILEIGWKQLGLARVAAITSPENTPSIVLLEKLGFRLEKVVRFEENGPVSNLFLLPRPGPEQAARGPRE